MDGNEPFFPPPPPRGEVYRVPAPKPAHTAASPAATRPLVVARPSSDIDDEPADGGRSSMSELLRDERTYWQRHRFFGRHPRVVGAVLTAIGAGLTWTSVDVLLHGGVYLARAAVLGPLALLAGLWPLAFGYPLEAGRPPAWWKTGYAACAIVGGVAGLVLLSMLRS